MQFLHQCLIVAVGSHVCHNTAAKGIPEQIEISDQIENLVTSEFINKTEFRVDHLAVMNDDMRIQKPAAEVPFFWAESMFSKVLKERAGAICSA